MGQLATIDVALDEMLVNLAAIVLRLARPELTRTPETRRALAQSVHQYAVCAARSSDPRVHALKRQLDETLKPSLRIVALDGAHYRSEPVGTRRLARGSTDEIS